VEREPLAPMDELSKELVWKFRYQTIIFYWQCCTS